MINDARVNFIILKFVKLEVFTLFQLLINYKKLRIMRSTFKLLFYVKRNVPKSDNSLPLMGRITINKGIVQFSLKMSVPPELWDSKACLLYTSKCV